MQKWQTKFEKAIGERQKMKKLMMQTQDFNFTTKNANFIKSPLTAVKRPVSRQSAVTFSSVDFNYIGNTNNVINKPLN